MSAVARNGLIFGEDGATWSGKVSGWLRGLRDSRNKSTIVISPKKSEIWNSKNLKIVLPIFPRGPAAGGEALRIYFSGIMMLL